MFWLSNTIVFIYTDYEIYINKCMTVQSDVHFLMRTDVSIYTSEIVVVESISLNKALYQTFN